PATDRVGDHAERVLDHGSAGTSHAASIGKDYLTCQPGPSPYRFTMSLLDKAKKFAAQPKEMAEDALTKEQPESARSRVGASCARGRARCPPGHAVRIPSCIERHTPTRVHELPPVDRSRWLRGLVGLGLTV